MAPVKCPLCSSDIKLLQIGLTEAIYMCPNTKCIYPIGCPDVNMETIQKDYKDAVDPATNISVPTNKEVDLQLDLNIIDDITLDNLIESVRENGDNFHNFKDFEEFLDLSFFDNPQDNV